VSSLRVVVGGGGDQSKITGPTQMPSARGPSMIILDRNNTACVGGYA